MPIQITPAAVHIAEVTIPLPDLVAHAQHHLNSVTATLQLEEVARQLHQADFPEADLTQFIRHVCKWGGYPGIAGRILKHTPAATIRGQFREAIRFLDQATPDVARALQSINAIRGLGTPSFASKHLRFLRPAHCPVLDSILATRLGYTFDVQGYNYFAADCLQIADLLVTAGQPNPVQRVEGRWFAADVEMALFAALSTW